MSGVKFKIGRIVQSGMVCTVEVGNPDGTTQTYTARSIADLEAQFQAWMQCQSDCKRLVGIAGTVLDV